MFNYLKYIIFDFYRNDMIDEFKPSDVVESDDEIDEDIENLYHYKERNSSIENVYRSVPNQANSVADMRQPQVKIETNIMPLGPNRLKAVNSSMNKSLITSVPMSRLNRRNHNNIKVNKSMLPERKRSNIKVDNRYGMRYYFLFMNYLFFIINHFSLKSIEIII